VKWRARFEEIRQAAALPTSAALVWMALLAAGCAPRTAPATPAPPAGEDPAPEDAPEEVTVDFAEVAPLWETVARPEEGFAGLDVWPGGGQRPWLIVAAAASHRLVIFDAGSGELLRELGALGERPGRFREPVDVAVAGDLAFVVERGK
jgi:3-phytase